MRVPGYHIIQLVLLSAIAIDVGAKQTVDTLPPLIEVGPDSCGCRRVRFTESRNIPNPPRVPPGTGDQIESGIQRIRFTPDPMSTNVREVSCTPPRPWDRPEFEVSILVCLIDSTKPGYFTPEALDYGGNSSRTRLHEVVAPSAPRTSDRLVDFGIVATGSSEYRSITITNPSAFAPMVIEDVYLKNGTVFSMDRPPSVPSTLDSLGARHVLRVSYKPVSRSNELDVDTLLLKSRCAVTGIALKGQPGSAEMVLNDWIIPLTGSNGADTLIDTCHDGFEISNAGTAGLTIVDIEVQGDREFFMKSWNPALPVLLEPRSSVVFSSLCFRTRKVGEYVAELVVRSNATGGDTTALLRSIVTTGVLDSRPSPTSVWYDDQRSVIVVEAVPSGGIVVVSDLQGRLCASSVSDGQTLHIDARAMSGTMLVTYPSKSGHRGQVFCISR